MVQNGVILELNLRREVKTIEELQRARRKHGLEKKDIARVEKALLELDGTLTVHVKGTTD